MFDDQAADTLLVKRCRDGDNKAFGILVVKYQSRVKRVVSQIVHNPAQAEDITQDTFFRAFRSLKNFRGESQFYTWLFRIAINTAKNAFISSKSRCSIEVECRDAPNDTEDTEGRNDFDTPEALLNTKRLWEAINQAMGSLSEDARKAIALREIDGLSYEEIAVIMCCPIGTVRSRIFRARELIAERVEPLIEFRMSGRW